MVNINLINSIFVEGYLNVPPDKTNEILEHVRNRAPGRPRTVGLFSSDLWRKWKFLIIMQIMCKNARRSGFCLIFAGLWHFVMLGFHCTIGSIIELTQNEMFDYRTPIVSIDFQFDFVRWDTPRSE